LSKEHHCVVYIDFSKAFDRHSRVSPKLFATLFLWSKWHGCNLVENFFSLPIAHINKDYETAWSVRYRPTLMLCKVVASVHSCFWSTLISSFIRWRNSAWK